MEKQPSTNMRIDLEHVRYAGFDVTCDCLCFSLMVFLRAEFSLAQPGLVGTPMQVRIVASNPHRLSPLQHQKSSISSVKSEEAESKPIPRMILVFIARFGTPEKGSTAATTTDGGNISIAAAPASATAFAAAATVLRILPD